jgi:hypothetical protein
MAVLSTPVPHSVKYFILKTLFPLITKATNIFIFFWLPLMHRHSIQHRVPGFKSTTSQVRLIHKAKLGLRSYLIKLLDYLPVKETDFLGNYFFI